MKLKIIIFSFSFQVNLAIQFFVLDFVIKIKKIKLKQEDHKSFLKYWWSPDWFIKDITLGGPYDELHGTLGRLYDHFHLMAIVCRRGQAYLLARVANVLVMM
jgi:hypothetical protein